LIFILEQDVATINPAHTVKQLCRGKKEVVPSDLFHRLSNSIAAEPKNRALFHKSMKLSTQIILLMTFIL